MKRRKFLHRVLGVSTMSFLSYRTLAASKNTRIEVVVDTSKINDNNTNSTVEISDNRNLGNPTNPKNATSSIDSGKWVQWKPIVKKSEDNRGDKVSISKIVAKRSNVGQNVLKGNEPYKGTNGVVRVDVKDSYIQNDWAYDIHIIVEHAGNTKTYVVDPKLRMIPI